MTNCNAGQSDQVWYFNVWTINLTDSRTVTVSGIKTTTITKKISTTTSPSPTKVKTKKVYIRSMYNYSFLYPHKTEGCFYLITV